MRVEDVFGHLPVLETERLLLRPVTKEDREDMYLYGADSELTRYVTWHTYQTIEDADTFIEYLLDRYEQGQVAPWAIQDKESGRMIGTAGFVNWNITQFRAEVGYVLARPYWNRGYMTEAMEAILQFGCEQMKLMRIEARCMTGNIGSTRVLEKLGMQYEGLLRKHLYAKGKFHDVQLYAGITHE
ncbi:GNAT family N-acetyltransferase [Paenibacillus wulumuqiensis]|uniref:GNAT family N-acetyltransferase n=1 Tax=Paenibacillus wulumuqiensis TaxID=1567107 RepID=UPI000619FE31|nr:GNAT family N-acetyltransferase [Paenibacillus wulumuqiensis]